MNVLDLFCGAGGFSLGLKLNNIEPLYSIDIWQSAIETYEQYHKNTIIYNTDIKNIKKKTLIKN